MGRAQERRTWARGTGKDNGRAKQAEKKNRRGGNYSNPSSVLNLDGPAGFQHYWHDLREESKVISRRSQGGGGAMVWGVIFYSGEVEIIFIEGALNAQKYLEIVKNVKGVIQNRMGTEDFVLQQDSAPTYNARVVKQWLERSETTLLPWPPFSSDPT
ncbi:hypothetical protein Trydic_g23356 [Trypoxylus dichotomus]